VRAPLFLFQAIYMTDQYGTADFYRHHFGDILADVGTGEPKRDLDTAVAIMQGFELAIIDWMKYHEDAAKSYRNLHGRFLLCKGPEDA
jgi:hypothetical protein